MPMPDYATLPRDVLWELADIYRDNSGWKDTLSDAEHQFWYERMKAVNIELANRFEGAKHGQNPDIPRTVPGAGWATPEPPDPNDTVGNLQAGTPALDPSARKGRSDVVPNEQHRKAEAAAAELKRFWGPSRKSAQKR